MSYGPPSPPPQPPSSRRRIWLIVLIAVALLCCGGSLGGGYYIIKTALEIGEPAREATTEFLTALQEGDEVSAYDQLCDQLRHRYTRDQFRQTVRRELGEVTDFRLTAFTVEQGDGGATGTVTAQLTTTAGDRAVTFHLREEHGRWRICGDPF
ncbi:MAG TPA: hypothetical protein VKZ67_03125 [Natronosporangium sp.]|jgi:hypothetical protein|nr:hypothetical protein [Natronosporangium sp.]